MKPQRNSIDGFTPRRYHQPEAKRPTLGTTSRVPPRPIVSTRGAAGLQPVTPADKSLPTTLSRNGAGLNRTEHGLTQSTAGLRRSDIDESLNSIDTPEPKKEKKRRFGRKRGATKPTKSKARRIVKWIAIILIVIGLGIGGWVAYKGAQTSGKLFKGGILGYIQNKPLKQDSNGRSNILVLGTSEDDPGHQGGDLTDSMMIVSIDQEGKAAAMFSIPRDLYVKYGMACTSGYQGKINAYFSCANTGTTPEDEQDRLNKTRQFVGEIFGMDVQYAVRVNNTVIKQAVDAVGGVDVKIEGNGPVPYGVEPGSVLDRNFDWRCGYRCHYVKYSPGVHHLDGVHALFLSMARGDSAPTYGLASSNFDREKNQQKIIIALKEKAVSTGTLTDLGKVTGLIDALGENLRTTFETSEIRTLMDLGTKIPSSNITTIGLFEEEEPVVKSGNYGGASVVMPVAGVFNYTQLRQFLATKLSTNPITKEGAQIDVYNGSGVAGVAKTESDKLTEAGYIVGQVGNAPEGTYPDVVIYQVGTGKTATKEKLAARFKVEVKTTPPPVAATGETNFVIIFGKDRSQNSQ